METPVLFIIFNRPDNTKRVFEAIRQQKPRFFFVAADGPRAEKESDIEKCTETRSIIKVDWDCEFHTLLNAENHGCGRGPSDAITWFFNNVEEGIILEDDCIPHPDFFDFCTELLDKYRTDEKIFFIGGTNFQKGIKRGDGSYYFSAGNQGTWGWATWKRAWKNFDYQIKDIDYKRFKNSNFRIFNTSIQRRYWMEIFESVKKDQFCNSCWDYQFYFSGWVNGCLAVIPNKNLIRNIGFDVDSTHTEGISNPLMNLLTYSILPLIHPSRVYLNKKADLFLHKNFIQPYAYGGIKGIIWRFNSISKKLKKILNINGSWSQLLLKQKA